MFRYSTGWATVSQRRRQLTSLIICALFPLLLLSACTTVTQRDIEADRDRAIAAEQSWQDRQQKLKTLQSWKIHARMAAKFDNESWTANINWTQSGENYSIQLYGAFGQGQALIVGSPEHIVISLPNQPDHSIQSDQAGQTELEGSDAGQLLKEQLGINFPLQNMGSWLLGLPGPDDATQPDTDQPGIDQFEIDEQGRLKTLGQSGWLVSYGRYIDKDGLALPRRITISQQKERIRIIIDRWLLDKPASAEPVSTQGNHTRRSANAG